MWEQILILVISLLVSYFLAPTPQTQKPASLDDFDIPSADEGKELGVVFGTVWIKSSNCLWYGDLKSTAIKSGGK